MKESKRHNQNTRAKQNFDIAKVAIHRYLHGLSTASEKETLESIDLTQIKSLWSSSRENLLPKEDVKRVQIQVFGSIAEKERFPEVDWNVVSQGPQIKATPDEKGIQVRPSAHVRILRVVSGAAAAVMLLFALNWVINQNKSHTYYADATPQTLLLPDSTHVVMNQGSRLKLSPSFNKKERKVEMTGEVFFDVKPNPDKPFIIRHGDLRTEVKGTSFTIRNYPELSNNVIIVNTGKVQVSGKQMQPIMLTRDMQLAFDTKAGTYAITSIDADTYAHWTDGHMVLRGADLQELALRVKQFYGKELIVNNQAFGTNVSIDAEFDESVTITEMMESLKLIYGFTYRVTETSIVVD